MTLAKESGLCSGSFVGHLKEGWLSHYPREPPYQARIGMVVIILLRYLALALRQV